MKTKLFFVSCCFSIFSLAKPVVYSMGGKIYEGYFVSRGAKAPLVFLLHDWDGLTDYEVKRADMLAKLGYSVFAIDLFGQGVRPKADTDRKQHTGELQKDRQKMRDIMASAFDAAKKNGLNLSNAVVMGYCFGGAAALEAARSGADFKGFVSFHGGLGTPEGQNYQQTKGRILILHGTADTAISMQDFGSLGTELEKAGVPHELIAYGGAPHAFTVFGSDRYREDADKKSWARFTEFLKEVFKKS